MGIVEINSSAPLKHNRRAAAILRLRTSGYQDL
jgi:hypothetical protein